MIKGNGRLGVGKLDGDVVCTLLVIKVNLLDPQKKVDLLLSFEENKSGPYMALGSEGIIFDGLSSMGQAGQVHEP